MYREISDLGLFVQTSPYGLGLYKKDLGPIFLRTDLAFGYYEVNIAILNACMHNIDSQVNQIDESGF